MQPTRLILAAAAGIAVSTVYAAQPLLVTIGTELGIAPSRVGLFVTVTQLGYALGLFFVVPLGDLFDRRRLIRGQFVLLAVALLATGLARNAVVLFLGLAAIGALAVVTQSLVVYGAALSEPAERGRTVGAITSGVITGILLARTVAGIITDLAGWRAVYLFAGALCLACTLTLPRSAPQPANGLTYGGLLRSTVKLWREPVFRSSALRALFIFTSFSTLWSSMVLPLTERGLSHTAIGLFGLIGATGALAAGPTGRLVDRGLGERITIAGSVLLATSWLVTAWTPKTLVALAIGAVLLDLAVQAVHVTNQSRIYRPDAGSRLIGGYMVFYSAGSGLGAVASTALYERAGWTAVCILGGASAVGALVTSVRAVPRISPASRPCESCP